MVASVLLYWSQLKEDYILLSICPVINIRHTNNQIHKRKTTPQVGNAIEAKGAIVYINSVLSMETQQQGRMGRTKLVRNHEKG